MATETLPLEPGICMPPASGRCAKAGESIASRASVRHTEILIVRAGKSRAGMGAAPPVVWEQADSTGFERPPWDPVKSVAILPHNDCETLRICTAHDLLGRINLADSTL